MLEQVFPRSLWKALLTQADTHTSGYGGPHTGGDGYFLKELWPCRDPILKQVCLEDWGEDPLKEQGKSVLAGGSRKEELLWINHNFPFSTSL